jgi:hypothetical protein
VVGLLFAGNIVNRWTSDPAATPAPAPQVVYVPGPPGGPPGVPAGGASDRPGGTPELLVNQPMGDGVTVFVVHGRGWVPGTTVTVALAGRSSGLMPVVDLAGTFNYAIDQGHKFFPGPIPAGDYTVVATSPQGTTARTTFSVHP